MGKVLSWFFTIVSFGLLTLVLVQVIALFTTPSPPHRLQLVQDVALPSIVVSPAQLKAIRSDHFDFQTLDPQTGLLFMAHTGPSDAKVAALTEQTPNLKVRGNITVFDTRQGKLIGSVDVQNIHGVVAAPDLHMVYAAGSINDVVYAIDERSLKVVATINLDVRPCKTLPNPCENPDSIEYDPADHKVFASSPAGQNESVIDALNNRLIGNIDLSGDKAGDTVGHTHYDPVSQRVFVVVQPLQASANAPFPPGRLVAIDPVTGRIVGRAPLPSTCVNAHGMNVDSQQQVAFVACIDSQNLVMINLRSMSAFGSPQQVGIKPDIVTLDNGLHVLYVGCNTALSVFDESKAAQGVLAKVGRSIDYVISSNSSHTVAVNQSTHDVYLPLTSIGSRPVLRIEHYDPNGQP
jgi:DNA-binding beta-propeller fold protein YncE